MESAGEGLSGGGRVVGEQGRGLDKGLEHLGRASGNNKLLSNKT